MKKIVFLDIDGTLVTPNYPLSDFVKKGIKKARENGHLIFLCTGRNRVGIESIMSDDFDGCICSAGGYLEIKGEMIETTYLDKEKVFYLLHIVYEHLFSEPLPIVKTAIYRSKEGGDGSAN